LIFEDASAVPFVCSASAEFQTPALTDSTRSSRALIRSTAANDLLGPDYVKADMVQMLNTLKYK
jgi:hypothetical protein